MFDPCRVWQYFFLEIDHEIFSMVILSFLLIQERHLSILAKKYAKMLVNCLED